MFSLGLFVTLVSIIRLESLITFAHTKNLTWDYVQTGYWSTIETHVGLICACLPAIRGLFRRLWPPIFGDTTAHSSSGLKANGERRSHSAWNFFATPLTTDPNVAARRHILVQGPYLVRSASIHGDTVEILGDNANTTSLDVYTGNPHITKIKWNHKTIPTKKTAYGSLKGQVPGAEDAQISLPPLGPWKAQDTLPEINPDYDDSNWTLCNKTTTVNAQAPLSLPVLYSGDYDDYGYHTGTKIYRARFDGKAATGANITVQSGAAAGWAGWLNGAYVGGAIDDPSLATTQAILSFNTSSLRTREHPHYRNRLHRPRPE
ncbi:hypothetical protein BJX70DRAFT_401332 [Aspergillus crustosus]